jgi:hypothetical protein
MKEHSIKVVNLIRPRVYDIVFMMVRYVVFQSWIYFKLLNLIERVLCLVLQQYVNS